MDRFQAVIRGFLCRKHLQQPKDNLSIDIVKIMLDRHIDDYKFIEAVNQKLDAKKIRQSNFPSHLSENLVKFLIASRYHVMPSWNTHTGDLCFYLRERTLKMEVKAFSSTGPTSFGSNETWDWIYFLDATRFHEYYFSLYEVRLSNDHPEWQQLRINQQETYQQQCQQKRRPRLKFSTIEQQLKDHCRLIYSGHVFQK